VLTYCIILLFTSILFLTICLEDKRQQLYYQTIRYLINPFKMFGNDRIPKQNYIHKEIKAD
jgi:hypothetical protein